MYPNQGYAQKSAAERDNPNIVFSRFFVPEPMLAESAVDPSVGSFGSDRGRLST